PLEDLILIMSSHLINLSFLRLSILHATYVSVRPYEALHYWNLSVLIDLVKSSAKFSLVCIFKCLHLYLLLLLEQNDIGRLYALFWNERLDFLQCARHSDCHKTEKSSLVCARAPLITFEPK
ncbi:hypothetical protein PanWU01x14_312600, partial [Parasponia andersonii]